MEISYDSEILRDICEFEEIANKHLEEEVANKLRNRWADLESANSISDVLTGNPQVIPSKDNSCLSIDLGNDNILILKACNLKKPPFIDGKIDWTKVNRVKIIHIGEKK